MKIQLHRPKFHFLVGLLWFCTVVAGTGALAVYEHTPGSQSIPAHTWPAQSSIPRSSVKPTLIMFAHPRCPCTRAALEQLSQIIAACPDKAQINILFMTPKESASDSQWAHSDLWETARSMSAVTPLPDLDTAQALLFGATTSGQVFLYAPSGELLFCGAVTSSRGHIGPNIGQTSIINLLNGQPPAADHTPAYGCSLFTPSSECLASEGQCHQ